MALAAKALPVRYGQIRLAPLGVGTTDIAGFTVTTAVAAVTEQFLESITVTW